MAQQIEAGRLALREEGEFWNAYYAPKHSMEGAILLGSIRIAIVKQHPDQKLAFMELMQGVVTEVVRAAIGAIVSWPDPPESAPESERSGHG